MRTVNSWKNRARLSGASAVVWLCCVGPAVAQPAIRQPTSCGRAADVDLHQNWSGPQKVKFWFDAQGSRIMPYSWFIALEQEPKDNEKPFIDSCFMESMGFIAVPGHKLPIGFARDTNRTGTATWLGLTCAACHTSRLAIGEHTALVEGGPALVDFTRFLEALVGAIKATYDDDAKFKRWADRVNDTSIPQSELRRKLKLLSDELTARLKQNTPTNPYGYGRVDAFGHIFNRVFATEIKADGNARTPDAPVSYPFLWDTPRNIHDTVQWNWSAPNKILFGLIPGDLLRNLGEMLGVFGVFDMTRPSSCLGTPCYKTSSFNRAKMENLEKLVQSLWSPLWPSHLDGMKIVQERADAGREIYKQKCIMCHTLLKRDDPKRKAGDHLVLLREIETDSSMTDAFNARVFEQSLESGILEGRLIGVTKPFRTFDKTTSGNDILKHVFAGVLLGAGRNDERAIVTEEEQEKAGAALQKGYKARSLNGIWATAPYLHNGSVPNLRTLLSRDRGTGFWVGNNAFDPLNVGLSLEKGPNATWFDPTKAGNSNQGHWFGVDDLDKDEAAKNALLEYLKTL